MSIAILRVGGHESSYLASVLSVTKASGEVFLATLAVDCAPGEKLALRNNAATTMIDLYDFIESSQKDLLLPDPDDMYSTPTAIPVRS